MDLNTTLIVLAGLVVPALNSVLKQPAWSKRTNWLVAVATAAGLGGLVEFLSDGQVTAEELVNVGLVIFAAGQAIYHLLLRNSTLNAWLERLMVWRAEASNE